MEARATEYGIEIFDTNRSEDTDRYGAVNFWKLCLNRQI